MKTLLLLITVLIVLVLGWFIGSQNSHTVLINYLVAETQIRMSVLLSITFLSGVALAWLFALIYIVKLKWQLGSLQRKVKKLAQPTTTP
ncbi:LapA family protein [Paraglaciecola aestuariivivens]